MSRFTSQFHKFFTALEKNNNREWFHKNKTLFKDEVEAPFHHFIGELMHYLENKGEIFNKTSTKDYVYRIYRDVRFSKDKSPYKVQMSAILSPEGRKSDVPLGLYLEANHDKFHIYEGLFRPSKSMLYNVRNAIAQNIEQFEEILNHPKLTATFSPLLGDKNKRLPKEFQEAALRTPLLYFKSYYIRAELSSDLLLMDNLPEIVWQYHKIAKPFTAFLNKALSD